MADNVSVTAGTGTTIAADEVTDATLGSVKVQYVKIMDGTLDGTSKASVGSNGLAVDGSGVTQPISAASLPLPSGAATAAKQPALGTAGTPSSDVITVQGKAGMTAVVVDGSAFTQPVSASTLPLPTGAATAAKQDTGNTSLSSIDGKLVAAKTDDYDTGAGTDTVQTVGIALPASGGHVVGGTSTNPIQVSLSNTAANSTAVKVDGSAVTQPVSGTFWQTTQPVSGTVSSKLQDGSGNAITSTTNALDVNIKSGSTSGTVTQGSTTSGESGMLVQGAVTTSAPSYTTAQTNPLSLDTSGNLRTSVSNTVAVSGAVTANAGTNLNTSALALESGGNLATAATNTGNTATNTTNIPNVIGTAASAIPSKLLQVGGSDGTNARAIKTNSSGQLDIRPLTSSDQITTVPSGTQTVSGTVTVQQSTASSLKVDLSGTAANSTAIKVDGSAVTQPVSGTVSVNALPSGTNTIGDVNLSAAARGGYAVSSQTNLTTTATVSGAAGKFGGAMFINLNSAPAYIQVFDTTGAVTLGTTTPTFVIPIPANSTAANGVGFVLPLDVGIAISNGIKVAATTTATGSTTVSTGLTGFVYYK